MVNSYSGFSFGYYRDPKWHGRGLEVTVVDRASHVLPPVDADMARYFEARLRHLGYHLRLSATLAGIRGSSGHPLVDLADGTSLSSDLVVLGLGVRPSLGLASMLGLTIGSTGAIQVDDQMRTSRPNVWAAGDAVEKRDLVTGAPR